KAVNRGKLSEPDRDAALGRITTTTSLDDFGQVDLVVEAVAEDLEVKRGIFATLDEVCKPGAILATTTSSLPVVECAAATSRPGGRHRHRHEGRRRAAHGPLRAAGRSRSGRLAGHSAQPLPGVPGARLRPGTLAGAAGHSRPPGPQDRQGFPRLLVSA